MAKKTSETAVVRVYGLRRVKDASGAYQSGYVPFTAVIPVEWLDELPESEYHAGPAEARGLAAAWVEQRIMDEA